jgi:hypothetical protein
MRKWFPNLILTAVSLAVTILIAEVVLRTVLFSNISALDILKVPRLYAEYERDATEHLYKEDYWKLRNQFYQVPDMAEPHPLLGWSGNFNNQSFEHADEYNVCQKRPVLLFGDSFTQCIDTARCFEDFLNKDTTFSNRFYLLNYGVGGFGIDQIHLLMEKVVPRFENPIVIFGMLTTDMDRSMLSFRDAPKPYISFENDELKLSVVPVKLKSSEYIEQNPIDVGSYVLALIRNSWNWLLKTEASEASKNEIVQLNGAIIKKQVAQLREAEIEPMMLLFQPINQPENEWRCAALLSLFDEMNLEVIDAKAVLSTHLDSNGGSKAEYYIPEDLHPNSNYNRLIAAEVKKRVEEQATVLIE